jgi:hypothetical protein
MPSATTSDTTPTARSSRNLDGDHHGDDTHVSFVPVSNGASAEIDHSGADFQSVNVDPADALLLIQADRLDDIERTRIANENRLRSLAQVKGLAGTEAEAELAEFVAMLVGLERQATRALEKAMKAHPFGPWVQRTKGIGLKQAARMIAAIGDPIWNGAANRPRRGPAELWQFAGHGDPARSKLRKGQPVEHSPTAKMRVHLVAESCMKQRESPYRAIYDRERAKWADRDVSDGHAHNHALRVVGKEVLKDLFNEARALDQTSRDSHTSAVKGA